METENEKQEGRVFVVGATGAVGKEVVKELAENNIHVTVFARRNYNFFPEDDKKLDFIHQELIDFDKDSDFEKFDGFETAFCCMGTTRKKAGSDEAFIKVDYDYVINTAEAAKQRGCKNFYLVSSIGANANSWFLYPRVKGKVEAKLTEMNFERLVIYRPSVLVADRGESRFLEHLSIPFSNLSSTYQSMPVNKLAKCMVHHFLHQNETPAKGCEILENKEIHSYFTNFNLF